MSVNNGLFLILMCFSFQSFSQIEVGAEIPSKAVLMDSSRYILTNSASIKRSYLLKINRSQFSVTLDSRKNVDYIETRDEIFKTPEGATMKMKYNKLKTFAVGKDIQMEKGWAKYIRLKSGWFAAFPFDKSVTENSEVSFFFKR